MSPLTVILSETIVRHVIRMNRVLSYSDELVGGFGYSKYKMGRSVVLDIVNKGGDRV